MAGGPGSYVFGAEEKKELMDVIENASLFRYGTPGVVDMGLGAGTGINVNSTEEEINQVAQNIREIVLSL